MAALRERKLMRLFLTPASGMRFSLTRKCAFPSLKCAFFSQIMRFFLTGHDLKALAVLTFSVKFPPDNVTTGSINSCKQSQWILTFQGMRPPKLRQNDR